MNHYYTILGLKTDATLEQIKKAYRKGILTYHPDRNPNNPQAASKFIEIQHAYKMLTNSLTTTPKNNPKKNAPPDPNTFIEPNIEVFVVSKKYCLPNDIITISWRCTHADRVLLQPFGFVASRGSKTVKFTNRAHNPLEISITAYYTPSLKKKTAKINIYNINLMPEKDKKYHLNLRKKDRLKYLNYPIIGLLILGITMLISIIIGYHNRHEYMYLYCDKIEYKIKYNIYNTELKNHIQTNFQELCNQNIPTELKHKLIINLIKNTPID